MIYLLQNFSFTAAPRTAARPARKLCMATLTPYFGKNLKALRIKCGLTQTQVADELRVVRQAVSNWENGKTQPPVPVMQKLSVLYGVPLNELAELCYPSLAADKPQADPAERAQPCGMPAIIGSGTDMPRAETAAADACPARADTAEQTAAPTFPADLRPPCGAKTAQFARIKTTAHLIACIAAAVLYLVGVLLFAIPLNDSSVVLLKLGTGGVLLQTGVWTVAVLLTVLLIVFPAVLAAIGLHGKTKRISK